LSNAFFDLSPRLKLRVTGTDRERFLNGQLSNDVRKATRAHSIEACILNTKGKLNAHVFVAAESKSYILDADAQLRESLQRRLERYIVADDVQLADESDRFSVFHVLGETPPALANECQLRSTIRFGEPGYDIWTQATRREDLLRELSRQFKFCDTGRADVFRIERGIPRWGRELTEEIIPIEANLEERTIDYEKGCYVGQEVISRMKMSGQTNKRLCGFVAVSRSPLTTCMKLFPMGEEKKEVGWITSAAHSERLGKEIALGFVRRGFNRPKTQLEAIMPVDRTAGVPVEVVDLPFD
jgi:folate-binding protein YgfZ